MLCGTTRGSRVHVDERTKSTTFDTACQQRGLMAAITLPTREITDRDTFHSVCQRTFGFPAFYGRNMEAWIDCMSYLDEPESGMSSITLKPGELLLVTVPDAEALEDRAPDTFDAFIRCTASVNRRFVERGSSARIGLLLA